MYPDDPRSEPPLTPPYRPGPHRAALLVSALTLPLLFLGGSVTSYGVGMAVPDWPTTFGMNMFLYNFWHAPFGVRVEHSHRLFGAGVGLATIVLTGSLLAFDRRPLMKALGVVALAAVIAQGVMGGLRVNQISLLFAALHGSFAQAFFGFTVALCVLTGRKWQGATKPSPDPGRFRLWGAVTLALVYGQIVVGAWFRHFRSPHVLWTHIALAFAVIGASHALYGRVRRAGESAAALRASAGALAFATTFQIALGVVALVSVLPLGGNPRTPTLWEAMSRTVHQTNGALLLASAVVFCLRAFRAFGPARAPEPAAPSRNESELAPRAVEALA